MKFFQMIVEILRGWTDSVAAAIIAGFDRVASPRVVRMQSIIPAKVLDLGLGPSGPSGGPHISLSLRIAI